MFHEILELLFSNLSYKSYKYKTAPFYYQICEELTKYEKTMKEIQPRSIQLIPTRFKLKTSQT